MRRALLVALIVFLLVPPAVIGQRYAKREFVVVYDGFHAPSLSFDELSWPLEELNSTLQKQGAMLRYIKTEDRLTPESLMGVDLLIVPPANGSVGYTEEEAQTIANYVQAGGSVLILGLPLGIRTFDPTTVNVIMDKLFEEVRFFTAVGASDAVVDYSNNSYGIFKVNKSNAKGETLASLISRELYLKSASLEGKEEKAERLMSPPTSVRLDKSGAIYYNNSGFTIMVFKKFGAGYIAALGFGQIFSNLTAYNNVSWRDLGANKEFAVQLLHYLLKLEEWEVKEPIEASWMPYIFAGISVAGLILTPFAMKADATRREKLEKRKKEVKISEVLKKLREKG